MHAGGPVGGFERAVAWARQHGWICDWRRRARDGGAALHSGAEQSVFGGARSAEGSMGSRGGDERWAIHVDGERKGGLVMRSTTRGLGRVGLAVTLGLAGCTAVLGIDKEYEPE